MEAKIREGCYRKKVWIAGGNATMLVQTWLNFKKKKWENSQEIKSLRQTIHNNNHDSAKENSDLRTELHNAKFELEAVRNGEATKEF
jgi:hypothetical protein